MKQYTFARSLDFDERETALSDLLDSLNTTQCEARDCDCAEAMEELRWYLYSTRRYLYACDRDDALEIEDYITGALAGGLSAPEIVIMLDEAIELCKDNLEYIAERRDEEGSRFAFNEWEFAW